MEKSYFKRCRHFIVFSYIWKPDPHFDEQNSQQGLRSLGFDTSDERFFVTKASKDSNLKLRFTKKIKVDIICDMHFENFPFDSQNCKFFIKSLKGQKTIR